MRHLKVVHEKEVTRLQDKTDLLLINDIYELVEVLPGNWGVIAVNTREIYFLLANLNMIL